MHIFPSVHNLVSRLARLALVWAVLTGGWQPARAQPVAADVPAEERRAPSATQIDLLGPPGSGWFGDFIAELPNGNFVVTDRGYDAPGPILNVGAVYLYDGKSLELIDTLTGSHENDLVHGVLVLSNGNYVVGSTIWDAPGPISDVGAVTLCDGETGCPEEISAENSLVGSKSGDQVGAFGVIALNNGNYIVRSRYWNAPGPISNVGAVTWCSGETGCHGEVSAANSLVGTHFNDSVGGFPVTVLDNSNYVIRTPSWDALDGTIDVGTVTWCSGDGGCVGEISAANSLVGSQAEDSVGLDVIELDNGNYVVNSYNWNAPGPVAQAGAVTWCNGNGGCTGTVSPANSLVGSTAGNQVGWQLIDTLPNGNYVVSSYSWDGPGPTPGVGAVTWCSGETGCVGPVSAANSLVGSTENDGVGFVTLLSSGNYVVRSTGWDAPGPVADVGAVTWCSGEAGCIGPVSAANSLVGSQADDAVGRWSGVHELSNGNYVVNSPTWDSPDGVADVGASTWCTSSAGCRGTISPANSLVGTTANDRVGSRAIIALDHGNYLVHSPYWDNPGLAVDAGAVTWCSGVSICTGTISAANSLVGSTTEDWLGSDGVLRLANGNYIVQSDYWDAPGGVTNAGAVTWCSGDGGCVGAISTDNSLVGSTSDDLVGTEAVALSNGNYVVGSYRWNGPGPVAEVGAVTWCSGETGCIGPVSAANSLVGSTVNDHIGYEMIVPLSNGNYVVGSENWDHGLIVDAGAVTWCSGTGGCVGSVSPDNSLVGSTADDHVGGLDQIQALDNGNYLVRSNDWDNQGIWDGGAVTLGAGYAAFPLGEITVDNSVLGEDANGTFSIPDFYLLFDPPSDQLFVGLPEENKITIFKQPHTSIRDGVWSTPDTWDYGAPVERSDIVIAGGFTVTLQAEAAAQNMTLQDGRVALGDYSLTVDQSLAVDGTPGIERMIVADDGGALRKRFYAPGVFTFPIGDQIGEVEYSPFTVEFTAGSFAPGAFVAAQVVDESHPALFVTDKISRYWKATQEGIGDFIYDATLYYLPGDVQGSEAAAWGLKYDAGRWTVGWPANPSSHTFSFTGLTSFSDFTSGSLFYAMQLAPGEAAQSGDPGTVLTYTLSLTNSGIVSDSYLVSLAGNVWPTGAPATIGPLEAGEAAAFTVTMGIPAGASGGDTDIVSITAASQTVPGLASTSTLVSSATTIYALQIAPSAAAQSGDAGETLTYPLSLTNNGNVDDSFAIALQGSEWPAGAPATVGPLEAGEAVAFTVTVMIPTGASGGESDSLNVTAASQGAPQIVGSAVLSSTARARYGLLLSPSTMAQSGALGETLTYMLSLTNSGNAPDTFLISLSGQTWESSAPQTLALLPGQSATIQVRVTIPIEAAAGESDAVLVTIRSQADASQAADANLMSRVEEGRFRLALPVVIE